MVESGITIQALPFRRFLHLQMARNTSLKFVSNFSTMWKKSDYIHNTNIRFH